MFINVPLNFENLLNKKIENKKRLKNLNLLHPSMPIVNNYNENCIYNFENFLGKSSLKKMLINVIVPQEKKWCDVNDIEYTSISQEAWEFNLN